MRTALIAACILAMAGGAAAQEKKWPKELDPNYFKCEDNFVTVPVVTGHIVSYRKSDIVSVHYTVDATGKLSLRFIVRSHRITNAGVLPRHWKRFVDCLG